MLHFGVEESCGKYKCYMIMDITCMFSSPQGFGLVANERTIKAFVMLRRS
jgi:hypothetical protein